MSPFLLECLDILDLKLLKEYLAINVYGCWVYTLVSVDASRLDH
jgi:hypothetical protein